MTLGNVRRTFSYLAVVLVLGARAVAAAFPNPGSPSRIKNREISTSHSVSAAGLQQFLAAEHGKSDRAIARKLSHLYLTERPNDAAIAALQKDLPGRRSRSALLAIADASAFLSPPSAEILPQPPPSLTEQRQIIAKAVDYVSKALPRLPNLYADEAIVRYRSDIPEKRSSNPSFWREIGTTKAVVSYRDGKEAVDYVGWVHIPLDQKGRGLLVQGVFGPMLSTVIVDAAQGKLAWDHWERGKDGPLAVFHYEITRTHSQYVIGYYIGLGGNGVDKQLTAYHGVMSIDPATGTILRLTAEADPPFGNPILESNIMVQYGPVEIGGKPYVCPLRSVSLSLDAPGLPGVEIIAGAKNENSLDGAQWLNDTTFANYHLFRSDMRILSGPPPQP